ncbi:hypothetical protein DV737_g3756, partial [Chaetothyriales sp. CBS 132003]
MMASTEKNSTSLVREGSDIQKYSTFESGSVAEAHVQTAQSDGIPVKVEPKRTWKSYLWDTFDKSPEERRFLFKLDAVLLSFASLGYFIKYLDQVNISNAFVSGMKEDLSLYGNQLNYMQSLWTVGYVIGEIPSNMLLTRVRPSLWIPACEVTWATMTILLAVCKNAQQMYVLRFFIGLAESTFYPGMQYIIGSWYRGDELAKRSCLFHVSSAIGTMFSGYLMAAVYHLDGVGGWKGWQWLFIVNTIISLPIAIAGFFMLPDLPEITQAWWLKPNEIALAKKRMQLEGRANRAPYTKAKFKRIFSSWHIYLLPLLYILFNNGGGALSQPAFSLWLKSRGFSVEKINLYPTLTALVQVLSTLAYAWSSDTIFKGERWPPIVFSGAMNIVVYVSLTIWDISLGWKWACFFLAGFSGGISGLTYAWAHEICSDDNEERALVTGTMNEMAYVFQAWLPLLIWQQVEAPSGQYAYQTPPRTPDAERTANSVKATEGSDDDITDLEVLHAPPGPCYAGLKNNVSLTQMKTTLAEWPDGLEDFVNQRYLEEYIQSIAHSSGVDKIARYNTRVEEVTKLPSEGKWRVLTTSLKRWDTASKANPRLIEEQSLFDAVVVASGHYNMPRVPDIPGLKEWKARFPERVWHSKRYRSAAAFKGKRILLIGAGVSSNDIAKESDGIAEKVFQSSRGGDLDLPTSMLPPGAMRIGGVRRFVLDDPDATLSQPLEGRIPGHIELTNGSELCEIDQVILGTGYITSYPFLSQYHEDDKLAEEANVDTLVTSDGNMTHNLHKDIFFIPDPTLAFVGAPYHISTFSLFDFQAQVVARVFAGHVQLPDTQAMREEYRRRAEEKGLGRDFHSLRGEGEELAYVQSLVDWVNSNGIQDAAASTLATGNHASKGATLEQMPNEILRRILVVYCERTEDVKDLLNISLLSSKFRRFFKEHASHLCLVFARKQEMTEQVILENTYQIRSENGCWKGKELAWLVDGHLRATALRAALHQFKEVGALQTYAGLCNFESTTLEEQDVEHVSRRIRMLMLGAELCAIETRERAIFEREAKDMFRLHAASRGMITVVIAFVEAVQKRSRAEAVSEVASIIASTIGEHATISNIHEGWTQKGARWFTGAMAGQGFSSMQEFRDCFTQPDPWETSIGPFDLDNLPALLRGVTLRSSTARSWDAALSGTRRTAYAEWQALVPDEAALAIILREVGWSVALPDLKVAEKP